LPDDTKHLTECAGIRFVGLAKLLESLLLLLKLSLQLLLLFHCLLQFLFDRLELRLTLAMLFKETLFSGLISELLLLTGLPYLIQQGLEWIFSG
jgi:hypothetical protein